MKCLRGQPDPGRDRQPERHRQRERDEHPAGLPHHRQPLRERLDESRDDAGQPGREHALDAERDPAHALGVTRQHEEQRRAGQRDAGRGEPAQLDASEQRRIAGDRVGRGRQHEPRKQQQHGDEVEEALEDDRRERRRRVEAFTAREQVRPNDFTGARR